MKNRVCLITGATSGLGRATAYALAETGANLVVAGRNQGKTEQLIVDLRKISTSARIDYLIADLEQPESVKQLAEQFLSIHNRLHVLINNAGAYYVKREETQDGFERTFALNHLSYFLLTNLLIDTMKKSTPARVVCVASDAHRLVRGLNWEDLQYKRKWPFMGWNTYCQSKLANVYFTYELAARLKGSGVTANVLHPGFVRSGLAKNNGLSARIVVQLLAVVAKPPAKAAETVIWAATSDDMAGVSGKYLTRKKIVRSSKVSCDGEAAERLWKISCEMTGLSF